jgi:hypothetical protein
MLEAVTIPHLESRSLRHDTAEALTTLNITGSRMPSIARSERTWLVSTRLSKLPPNPAAIALVLGTIDRKPKPRQIGRTYAKTGSYSIPRCLYSIGSVCIPRKATRILQRSRSGPFQLLRFVVLSNDFFRALSIEALRSLHSLDIFSKPALCLTGSPNRQVTLEDVVDFFQSTAGGFWVSEEDVECHRCA